MRLADGVRSEVERSAFEAWRRESPDHEVAYQRELFAWETLDRARALRPPAGEPDPDLLADHAPAERPIRRRAPSLPWAAMAASATLAIGAATAVGVSTLASPAYATAIGEHRVVVLRDGSRIELNTNSKIVVRYRWKTREVNLVRGEAVFHVSRDQRPFVIRTAAGELEAGDADVAVRLQGGETAVTLEAGAVAVQAENANRPLHLDAQRSPIRATFTEAGATSGPITADEADRVLAWRRGAIALSGQSLAQAVEEFNRYNVRQIVVADPSIAPIRVGGYFQAADVNGFVGAVTRTFDVSAATGEDGSIYLRGRG